jgi:thiosulfate reductase cytochrome b subunit
MQEFAYAAQSSVEPRHSATVRITHWLTALSFFGLLVSGIAILLAHPRLYWGETGAVGTPSLLDLPLPFVLTGQSGWGRYLHFQSAWLCVLTGAVYGFFGLFSGHFRKDLLPAKSPLVQNASLRYNLLQRLAYLTVIFGLLPLLIWTGLAMSPAITSVYPLLVEAFGGQQSARTIHFFTAAVLILFVMIHIAMVWRAGFRTRVRAMITSHAASSKERI